MITGVLLAAGRGSRFDPSGERSKLLQPLANGDEVAVAAAKNLLAALPSALAVVAPGRQRLAERLNEIGCEVTICHDAEEGMAASLVHGVRQKEKARGWIIALADMPFVRPGTVQALAAAVEQGAGIVAPYFNGKRGNPIAFGSVHLDELLQLRGDQGARRLLARHPVVAIAVDDPGILQDIDTPDDLRPPN